MSGDAARVSTEGFPVLDEIVRRRQTWPLVAAKHGVNNPVPPWKTSLDGMCDVLDRSCGTDEKLHFTFKERRDEEDELTATRYAELPYPENQLVALAHSLLARGVIDEQDLRQRLAAIRSRLEAD
ncbi:thiocyanate hydrolase [Mycobacterium parmense]|uniref:Thiocyanate hydrolase subunit beta n=1 Tax=Mycobacterium parmense TaxID=185642 RepID=A0A7I7Z293_9MYCO|nr:thiocyanate hydrolase [Mycobacterium parmense]MCV7352591.1 thiocyanate hydrolase [Mycobacterium parmense]ORW55689.1 thiocyanate hydrolase [Mycobacterium parmense]BBZ47687.1 thiocyanate hydrolase subunit beta [Mycobacterium parmense]